MDERESWSQVVERLIREAMERGEFDNLPGAGQPLDLRDDPFVPADMRVAFRMLKRAGFAPEWIELDKEIRAELESCRRQAHHHRDWLACTIAELPRAPQPKSAKEAPAPLSHGAAQQIAHLRATHRRFLAEHQARLANINRKIERFNWLTPAPRLRRQSVTMEEGLEDLPDRLLQERGVLGGAGC